MGLVIDSFAGGGGASTGIEAGLGRPVDIAINHDREAVAMHAANHPGTLHHCKSVWQAHPHDVCAGRPVDLAWFSPDCTHHSKAKGGKPIRGPKARASRDLAWIVVAWARAVRPRVIMLENVEEFADWGPLLEDGRPCPERRGFTFRRWAGELKRLGYRVEWRELRACDHGAPTIRKRLYLIARRDGLPIAWPAPTHGPAGGLLPWRTAADIIDWSLPVHSIFMTKAEAAAYYRATGVRVVRPLAEATLARIARGVWKYVLTAAEPFIVPITHTTAGPLVQPIGEPLRTVTTAKGGEFALVAAFLAQHNGGARNGGLTGRAADAPLSTVTVRGTQQALVAATLSHQYGSATCGGQGDPARPLKTITAGGGHHALVQAFLIKYYGQGVGQPAGEPLHTATTRERFGLVTLRGEDWAIADIGMRMLSPRELFRAQGFPDSYVIDPALDGRPLAKTAQIRMCGNSVCPPVAEALVRANCAGLAVDARPAGLREAG